MCTPILCITYTKPIILYDKHILDNTDIDLGGVEFLPKPFTPDTLSKTIKSILK